MNKVDSRTFEYFRKKINILEAELNTIESNYNNIDKINNIDIELRDISIKLKKYNFHKPKREDEDLQYKITCLRGITIKNLLYDIDTTTKLSISNETYFCKNKQDEMYNKLKEELQKFNLISNNDTIEIYDDNKDYLYIVSDCKITTEAMIDFLIQNKAIFRVKEKHADFYYYDFYQLGINNINQYIQSQDGWHVDGYHAGLFYISTKYNDLIKKIENYKQEVYYNE